MRSLVLGLALLGLLVVSAEAFRAPGRTDDFSLYHRAAAAVAAGDSPYGLTVPGEERLRYVYPPLAAALLAPLSTMPEPAARIVWEAVLLAALAGCLLLLRRALRIHPDPAPRIALAFLAVFPFVRSGVRSGQVSLLLLFLMLSALLARGGTLRPGAALGAAIGIKLYPAGALLAWAAERKWKAVGWAVAAAILLSILVPAVPLGPAGAIGENARFWTAVVPRAAGAGPAPAWFGVRSVHSQSLPSAIHRWTAPAASESLRPGTPEPLLVALGGAGRAVLIVLLAAALLAVTWAALRRIGAGTPGGPLLRAGLVLALLPILGPVSNKAAFTALLPAWAALLALPPAAGSSHRAVPILAGTGLLLHLFPFRPLFGREFAWAMEAQSDILLGAIFVWLALCVRVLRAGEKKPGAGPGPV